MASNSESRESPSKLRCVVDGMYTCLKPEACCIVRMRKLTEKLGALHTQIAQDKLERHHFIEDRLSSLDSKCVDLDLNLRVRVHLIYSLELRLEVNQTSENAKTMVLREQIAKLREGVAALRGFLYP